MRIGIDACCWSNRRGFGRFTRNLVTQMVREPHDHEFHLVVDRQTADAGDFPAGARVVVVPTRQQPTEAASAEGSRSVFDMWRMGLAVSRLRPDVFFFPAVYSFFPLLKRVPTVVTFHDAIAENFPGLIFPGRRAKLFWSMKTWLARRQADRILTVSESARAEVAKAFHIPPSAITVIPEGPSPDFRLLKHPAALRVLLQKYQLPETDPLILYVGGLSPHKNLAGLLRSLDQLRRRGPQPWHAVLVGDNSRDSFYGCYQELLALRRELGLDDRVSFTGFIPNEELVALYNAATFMVLPSFSEGFGLPVVEAMACGLPVAVSRRGSLPEVVGDAGLLFEPDDPGDMASVLARMLGDGPLRAGLRAAGLRRVEQYSWATAARRTIELLEGLAGVNGAAS